MRVGAGEWQISWAEEKWRAATLRANIDTETNRDGELEMQGEQDEALYHFDWSDSNGTAQRPNYNRFFQVIDEARISAGSDVRDREINWDSPLRTLMSDMVWQTIAWMNHSEPLPGAGRVRFISEQPDAELLFLGAVLARDSVVLSDSAVELRSSELPNPIHIAYWEGLLDQMLLCREPLLNGRMVLCPAVVHRSVGRGSEERSYTLDFSNSLATPNDIFVRKNAKATGAVSPEEMTRVANQQTARSTITVPLLRIDLPVLRDVSVSALRDLFEQEPTALRRLRVAISDSEALSEEQLLSGPGLRHFAERLDFEIAEVQTEYERLLRGRELLAGTTFLGTLGVALAVTLPPTGAAVAAALGGTTAGLNALKYVFAVRDSKVEVSTQKYYLAWKALRAKGKS